MVKRIYITRRAPFQTEAAQLKKALQTHFGIQADWTLREGYDLRLQTDAQYKALAENILLDPVTDTLETELPQAAYTLAVEQVPGQFDQRADAVSHCLGIAAGNDDTQVRTFRVYQTDSALSAEEISRVESYLINPVENRKKNLDKLEFPAYPTADPVATVEGFIEKDENELAAFLEQEGFSMSLGDLLSVHDYFKNTEKRDPSVTELRVLDTYWSDHCRHSTFETELKDIRFGEGPYKEELETAFAAYMADRKEAGRTEKPITLMDMATLYARVTRARGGLEDQEISEEINAAAIFVQVERNGVKEPWLLQFKNETHNHPTEIEPFGGASTCVGGAIRDPLSGRAHVYQAMRITGAGDITAPLSETLPGKLPQSVISKTAAEGNSSYGNEIGLTATYAEEIFHPGYVAKRMELGAVVGASPADHVIRGIPEPGDAVLLIGGKTGRDGVGGATGSSQEHTEDSAEESSSEVQKGCAAEERKIVRLYKNKEAARLIKRSNDFGAGGVSVAIGEIADGVAINLDAVPVKYEGMDGTEIAISESQERMAVVVAKDDVDRFIALCEQENLDTAIVAEVTEEKRVVMHYRGQKIVDMGREFLNSAGVRASQEALLEKEDKDFPGIAMADTKETILHNLTLPQNASQQGIAEMFDATVGRTTVLLPYGGKTQRTPQEASVQTVPVDGGTNTASVLTYGFDPYVSEYEPFVGAQYSVVEALARQVAVGAPYKTARLSNQEYFERLGDHPHKWGKVVKALLGLYTAQNAFGTPSIGGKDSMSGTFHHIDVPPTLVTFAVTVSAADKTVSAELKETGSILALLPHRGKEGRLPDYDALQKGWDAVLALRDAGRLLSAKTVKRADAVTALIKMGLGNEIGFSVNLKDVEEALLPGSLIVEVKEGDLPEELIAIGRTQAGLMEINGAAIDFTEAQEALESRYAELFPLRAEHTEKEICQYETHAQSPVKKAAGKKPHVLIPLFYYTHNEYDYKEAFEKAGAEVETFVLRTQDAAITENSLRDLAEKIANSQILVLTAGDEPDAGGNFIATVLQTDPVRKAVEALLQKDGLLIGTGSGFNALLKTGLLPYGTYRTPDETAPTLVTNEVGRYAARMAEVSVVSNASPWMADFAPGTRFTLPIATRFGRLIAPKETAEALFANGQIACVFTEDNPTGSVCGIESLTSPCGHIIGRIAHAERCADGLLLNAGVPCGQDIFAKAVSYFA
jgi:phosphoribosylformylglycinamidine synthase